jgi:uncharacterized protein YjdB
MSRFLSFLYGLFLFIAVTNPEISVGLFHGTALAQELTDRPTNLIGIAGDGQVTLSFDPPSLAAFFYSETSYEITSSPPTTSTLTTQNTVTITGLTNGTAYQFVVTPKNDTAPLSPSDPSAPVTPKASTPAPIIPATASMNLTASATSLQLGQSLTLTASLTPTSATGSISFKDGTTILGTGTLANGTVSLSTSALAIGAHNITAIYAGDTNTSSATSSAQSVTITQSTSALTLAASANSLQLGQSLTLTASLSPTSATGSITFKDGATVLGTGPLANGTASLSTSALTIGAHSITAIYAGDTNTNSATSSAQSVTITQSTSALTLAASASSLQLGQSITLTASLTPSTATGSIIFKDGTTILGTGTLANGTASLTTSALTIGAHNITAIYAGDTNTSSATSSAQSVTITQSTSALTLAASASSLQLGQSVTLTANITPSTATGSITFQDGTTVFGTGTLANGTASLTTSALSTPYNPSTYMVHDIAALQYLYGANTSAAQSGASTNLANFKGFQTLWAPNNGVIDASSQTSANLIDTRGGAYCSIGIQTLATEALKDYPAKIQKLPSYSGLLNLGIAYGSVITSVQGGTKEDKIFANEAASSMTIDGGAGQDIAYLAGDAADWSVDQANKIYTRASTGQSITLHNIETVSFYDPARTSLMMTA